jgi:hypothetical protein
MSRAPAVSDRGNGTKTLVIKHSLKTLFGVTPPDDESHLISLVPSAVLTAARRSE